MTIERSNQQAIINGLDSMYVELIEAAKQLAQEYFEQASTLETGSRRHVKLMILVRQHTDQSWGIYWAKNIGAPGKPAIPYVINKGKGDKYPLGTFSHVKGPMKTLCRNYEKRLSSIRAACFQNRTLRRSLVAHGQQVERTIRAVARR